MKIWLICSKCGYTKEVLENELYDTCECIVCGEKMGINYNREKEEEPLGDNFPNIPDNREREMRDSIGTIGISHTWYMLEAITDVKLRLQYRDMFFKCGGQIPEREE